MQSYKHYLEKHDRLDYIKIKRFLETAYNTMLDIYSGYETVELANLKSDIDVVYKAYQKFIADTKYLKLAFENIFLSKQIEYVKLRDELKINKIDIDACNLTISKTQEKLNEYKSILSNLRPDEKMYKDISNKYKNVNKINVDSIHEVSGIFNENKKIVEKLENFYNINYVPFCNFFTEKINFYKEALLEILESIAYELDNLMWETANNSKAIQNHFKAAGIKEKFSSLIYLKYYVSSLDASKLSQKNSDLYKLLEYFEEKNQKTIAIFDTDIDNITFLKDSVLKTKKDCQIISSTRMTMLVKKLRNNKPSIMILNPSIKAENVETILNFMHKRSPDINIAFYVDTLSKHTLILAKKYHISTFIQSNASTSAKQKQIEDLISK